MSEQQALGDDTGVDEPASNGAEVTPEPDIAPVHARVFSLRRMVRLVVVLSLIPLAMAIGLLLADSPSSHMVLNPGPVIDLATVIEDTGHGFEPHAWAATTVSVTPMEWPEYVAWRTSQLDSQVIDAPESMAEAKDEADRQMSESVSSARTVSSNVLKAAGLTSVTPEAAVDMGVVGGPSAGLMLTLALVDSSEPVDLSSGRFIAGTGAVSPEGVVTPVGGVALKAQAAARMGAEVFLVPVEEESQALRAVTGSNMQVVPVNSVRDALKFLCNGSPLLTVKQSAVCVSVVSPVAKNPKPAR